MGASRPTSHWVTTGWIWAGAASFRTRCVLSSSAWPSSSLSALLLFNMVTNFPAEILLCDPCIGTTLPTQEKRMKLLHEKAAIHRLSVSCSDIRRLWPLGTRRPLCCDLQPMSLFSVLIQRPGTEGAALLQAHLPPKGERLFKAPESPEGLLRHCDHSRCRNFVLFCHFWRTD